MTVLFATHLDHGIYDLMSKAAIAVLVLSGLAFFVQIALGATQLARFRGPAAGRPGIRPGRYILGAFSSAIPAITVIFLGISHFGATYCEDDPCPSPSEMTELALEGLGVLAVGLAVWGLLLRGIYRQAPEPAQAAEEPSSSS